MRSARQAGDPDDVIAASAEAKVFESGFRPYHGHRLGPSHAIWALCLHSAERVLGLRRPGRYKVLPFVCLALAYLPAVAFVGVVALVPKDALRVLRFVPGPADYYPFVTAAILLFCVLAAPEVICPDRRYKTLSLYLASPLDRRSYLLAKAAAVMGLLLLVTLGPPLLLFVGLVLQNDGPRSFASFAATLGRIVAAGLCLSTIFTCLSMAIPSLTDRRAFASAGTLMVLAGSGVLTDVLVGGLGAPRYLAALALDRLPYDLVRRIFGLRGLPTPSGPPLPTWLVAAAAAGVCALFAGLAWSRIARGPSGR
jgi:ABC-2 type transport system permease protein